MEHKNLNEEGAEYRIYPLEGTYYEHLVQQHGVGWISYKSMHLLKLFSIPNEVLLRRKASQP